MHIVMENFGFRDVHLKNSMANHHILKYNADIISYTIFLS